MSSVPPSARIPPNPNRGKFLVIGLVSVSIVLALVAQKIRQPEFKPTTQPTSTQP